MRPAQRTRLAKTEPNLSKQAYLRDARFIFDGLFPAHFDATLLMKPAGNISRHGGEMHACHQATMEPRAASVMAHQQAPPGEIAFSTDKLPAQERFEIWREAFALKVAHLDVATADRENFRADIRVRPMPRIVLAKNEFSACSLTRTQSLLRDGDDSVCLIVCMEGGLNWRFGDESAAVMPGQAILVWHAHAASALLAEGTKTFTLRLERADAQTLTPALEQLIARPTAAADAAVGLLTGYCTQLMRMSEDPSPALAAIADGQLRELVAHIVSPDGDLARAAPFGGVKAARLRAVLDDIAAHLHDPGLSASAVAGRLRLTDRYVRQLLDGIGLSFSQHVRHLRLERASRMLRDVRAQHLRITDIVYAVGFQDLSHFNRAFRRQFGETPSAVRRAA
jgi:AraC-like DNA-binding protein